MRSYVELFNYTYTTSSQPWSKNSAGDFGSIVSGSIRFPYQAYANKAMNGPYSFNPTQNYRSNYILEFDLNASVASLEGVFHFEFYGWAGQCPYPALRRVSGGIRLCSTLGYGYAPNDTPGWAGWDGVVIAATTVKVKLFMKLISGQFHMAVGVNNGATYYRTPWVNCLDAPYQHLQVGCLNNAATVDKTASAYFSIAQIQAYDELTELEINAALPSGKFAPSVSPAATTQSSQTSVTLDYALDPTAPIYYTVDGSDPTVGSTLYTGPFVIGSPFTPGSTVTVKAIANSGTLGLSGISEQIYTYLVPNPIVAEVGGEQSYHFVDATFSVTAPGFDIYYTLDGSAPSSSSTLVSGNVVVPYAPGAKTLRTIAHHQATNSYSQIVDKVVNFHVASASISHNGNQPNSVDVVLSCATEDVILEYYINNGSVLTYNGPIHLEWDSASQVTIAAIARIGSTYSYNGPSNATIKFVVAKPVVSPESTTTGSNVEVTVSAETLGSAIYFTTDGSKPTLDSEEYTAPFQVFPGTLVQAVAYREGVFSETGTAVYEFEYNSTKPVLKQLDSSEFYAFYQKSQNYNFSYDLGAADDAGAVALDTRVSVENAWLCLNDSIRYNSSGNTHTLVGYKQAPAQYCYAESISKCDLARALANAFTLEFSLQLDSDTMLLLTNVPPNGYAYAFDADYHWLIGSYQQLFSLRLLQDAGQAKLESTYLLHGANPIVEDVDIPGFVVGDRYYVKVELLNNVLSVSVGTSSSSSSTPTSYTEVYTKAVLAESDWWLRSEIDTLNCAQPGALSNSYYGWKEWKLNYLWLTVSSPSSKWLKTVAGVTLSEKAQSNIGTFEKFHKFDCPVSRVDWDVFSSRCGNYDSSQYQLAGYNQYSKALGGFVLRKMLVGGSSSDNNLQLRWYRFAGDFNVETTSDVLLSIYRNINTYYAPIFTHALIGDDSDVEIQYVAGAGASSQVSVILGGSEIPTSIVNLSGVELEKFNSRFSRTSGVLKVELELNGAWVELYSQANVDVFQPGYYVVGDGTSERATRSALVVKSVNMSSTSTLCVQSSNQVLLHGCYFLVGGIGHGWSSQTLSLPLDQSGKVVYSKLTKLLTLRSATYYVNQDQEVLVALYRCNQTGLDHFTVVLSGDLVCRRNIVNGQVGSEEVVLGCGSSQAITDSKISWYSNGFLVSASVESSDFRVPTQAYRGFSNVRVIQTYEENNISMAFHKKDSA